MSSTPNNPYLVKSMNGAITIDDGNGTTIQNGTIVTKALSLNSLYASSTNLLCSLWSNIVSGIIYIGSQTQSGLTIVIGRYLKITDAGIDSTSTLSIGSTSGVDLGSTTGYVRTAYVPVLSNDVINLTYLNSHTTNLLNSTNTWSLSNTFSTGIITNLIDALTTTETMNIGNNLITGGSVNIGTGIGSYTRVGGVRITSNNIDAHATGILNLGNTIANQVIIGSPTIPIRTSYNAVSGTDILNYQTGATLTNGLLASAYNDWTGALNKFEQQIQANNIQALTTIGAVTIGTSLLAGGSLALGSYQSTIKAGGYTLLGNAIDMTTGNTNLLMSIGASVATAVAIGSTTIAVRSAYNAQSGDDLVNYRTMQTFTSSGVLASANNVFTGTYNQFNNAIYCNNYQGLTTTSGINIGTTITGSGYLTLGSNIIPIYLGSFKAIGNVFDTGAVAEMNIGSSLATTVLIGNSNCNVGIRTKSNLVIGPNVTPISTASPAYLGPCLEIGNAFISPNNYSNLDFHTSLTTANDYDSRIIATGGTTSSGNGTISMVGGTINITPVGNTYIGSATSTNTFIQNTDGLIIGTNPTSYNPATGQMSSNGLRMTSYGSVALIDFHSNTVGGINFDSRIISVGGTTAQDNGSLGIESGNITFTASAGNMNYTSNSHTFNGGLRVNSGISFGKGNLQGVINIQTGSNNPNVGVGSGNAIVVGNFSFQDAFSVAPIMNISIYTNTSASMGLIATTTAVSASTFTVNVYNSRNVTAPAGTWGYQWMAIGSY